MRRATNNEYKSFSSCWYFLKDNEDGSKDLRFKIYNKIMQFLQSEQGKKAISMNLKALFMCSNSFYQKIKDAFQEGISRLEFS
jgi:hypothetical protein